MILFVVGWQWRKSVGMRMKEIPGSIGPVYIDFLSVSVEPELIESGKNARLAGCLCSATG